MKLGYKVSSEEFGPAELIEQAVRAEAIGLDFVGVSDHFHPWIDAQGHAPFVWSVLGGIGARTTSLEVITAVTCPTIRIHPAILAQAGATMAALMPGRFSLGVGTGERLNEHVLGDRWPSNAERRAMLKEAVQVLRELWQGGTQSFSGKYYTVETARLFTLPSKPPSIVIAASGATTAELAAEVGDGLMSAYVDPKLVTGYKGAGGEGAIYGELAVCWGEDAGKALELATEQWPIAALPGPLLSELALPSQFKAAASLVTTDMMAKSGLPHGPDPQPFLKAIEAYRKAGYSHVFMHQIGPDQEGFFSFFEAELAPKLKQAA